MPIRKQIYQINPVYVSFQIFNIIQGKHQVMTLYPTPSPNPPFQKTNLAIGIICLVIGILAGLLATADIIMLMRIHKLYRSKDGVSMAQARKDAVTKLMSNKDVRDTVVDVGAAAATAAATGN